MNRKKRWPNKQAAKEFMRSYESKFHIKRSNGVIQGPKGLKYWAASDYVNSPNYDA